MQKITPFLWFDHNAEEAMQFYTSVFKNANIKILNMSLNFQKSLKIYFLQNSQLPLNLLELVS